MPSGQSWNCREAGCTQLSKVDIIALNVTCMPGKRMKYGSIDGEKCIERKETSTHRTKCEPIPQTLLVFPGVDGPFFFSFSGFSLLHLTPSATNDKQIKTEQDLPNGSGPERSDVYT
jgi:hypothetical protein